MKSFLALFLAGACTTASAQTPATNPMPDGSRDMYVGLGVVSSARYPGAADRKTGALPLLQVQWSNGIFLSGMSAGMHLSQFERVEFGPLLAVHGGRDQDGSDPAIGGIEEPIKGIVGPDPGEDDKNSSVRLLESGTGLAGMNKIKARVQGGIFVNVYLTGRLRLANSMLYGSGNRRDGMVWSPALQYVASGIESRHRVALTAGATVVNRHYNTTYFGISDDEANAGVRDAYAPGGGVRDVFLGAGWNWTLSPAWLVTSTARVSQLKGDAGRSPLVARKTNLTVSTGLAYRF